MHAARDEALRLAALKRTGMLDTAPEERFDRITRLAATILGTPMAVVSLIDKHRQWFKSAHGLSARETSRTLSFCSHAIQRREIMVVNDARTDPRFAQNALVTDAPRICFYAGCPLHTLDGHALGALAVIDTKPRPFSKEDRELLSGLAEWTRTELNAFEVERTLAERKQLDTLRTEFLTTAAHELRTPMASILGFTELLLQKTFDSEKRSELLGIIHEQARQLTDLLNELLDLARIESRKGRDFKILPQPLPPVLQRTLDAFLIPKGREPVSLSVAPDLPNVAIDEDKLQQALTNVLSNSYKYSPHGGPVSLCAELAPDRGFVKVHVRDQGMGMTAEQVSRVFERFYRADSTSEIHGSGLGMTLVKEIVELHGGSIEIRSALGAGTEVILSIPAAE